MIKYLLLLFFLLPVSLSAKEKLDGFYLSPYFNEQTVTFYYNPDIRIHINAPAPEKFKSDKPVQIILFALPNGNTIEQTIGKITGPEVDWHFDIQHIGAQTRFLRDHVSDYNFVTIYLEAEQKSWPAWKSVHSDYKIIIHQLVDYLRSLFNKYKVEVTLTGHSGGGRFIFSFLDIFDEIPSYVKRISFLDSNYGYEHEYGDKIISWLRSSDDNYLSVIAYNDSVALYNGKTFVSPTGGTWYRSRIMQKYFESEFSFKNFEDDNFIRHIALNGRIQFILKKNPLKEIYHTVQVERNGFIHAILSGTSHDEKDYKYYGSRSVYSKWIQLDKNYPANLTIPPRPVNAGSGSEFMQHIMNLPFDEREDEILKEISSGNIPEFLRQLISIESEFTDAENKIHKVKYFVMPDYLGVGSDSDFFRVPMGPLTAQKIADLFGAVLPTKKIVDDIYLHAENKPEPQFYAPIENRNELVQQFIIHNNDIDSQMIAKKQFIGNLTAGIKKDIIISSRLEDTSRTHHVTIYGWHKPDGKPIQPVTNIHIDTYVDYSHGVRLINNEFLLDGEVKKINEILTGPVLYKIFLDEDKPLKRISYIKKDEQK